MYMMNNDLAPSRGPPKDHSQHETGLSQDTTRRTHRLSQGSAVMMEFGPGNLTSTSSTLTTWKPLASYPKAFKGYLLHAHI